ncbi:MAG: MOSC N-terminal beta barrel domain-containing protein [Opitutus sp.]
MHVSGLHIYPVKSLRGIALDSCSFDAIGFNGDRRFVVVDRDGHVLTQRNVPEMALVVTELTDVNLVLRAPHREKCEIARVATEPPLIRTVSVWKSEGLLAEDCGNGPADWLSSVLKTTCRLLRVGSVYRRPVLDTVNAGPADLVSFADGYPFLVASESSLADLNDHLIESGEEAIPMNRFRPNIVVSGCSAFAEHTWPRLRIGSALFRSGGPCGRCIVTTTDQQTAVRHHEPLRTLASYRRNPKNHGEVMFGENLIHETKSGVMRVGDPVVITNV